jgi:hypothetical protein
MKPLTLEELTQVELATKGETRSRRQYSPEVVAAWLAAELVRAPAPTQHAGGMRSSAPRSFLAAVFNGARPRLSVTRP